MEVASSVTRSADLTIAQSKRFARVAKEEGTAVRVKIGNKEITFLPDIPDTHKEREVDDEEEINL